MIILPAIDLIDKKCVRLTKGVYTELSVYEEDPVKMAKTLVKGGAEYIHIIDLDSAIKGTKDNFEVIEKIRNAVDVPIQLGGGIRSIERATEPVSYTHLDVYKRQIHSVCSICLWCKRDI